MYVGVGGLVLVLEELQQIELTSTRRNAFFNTLISIIYIYNAIHIRKKVDEQMKTDVAGVSRPHSDFAG